MKRDITIKQTVRIHVLPEQIAAFCQRHHIRKLALFGSVLRHDFQSDSDIDVLVEYEPSARITYLDMATQEMELSQMLGRQVDLREPEELSRYFRQKVVDTAEVIYEQPIMWA
ncbi:MAG: nucleotidyltransferase domain-containing protein [Anaerolineae bacterium]|nr:nucleotidyltransferase domain-containing protein [Anaerolineae bacterium]